jgi:hypothetical protein
MNNNLAQIGKLIFYELLSSSDIFLNSLHRVVVTKEHKKHNAIHALATKRFNLKKRYSDAKQPHAGLSNAQEV